MARIRTIKPELPQDAKLARVSRATRYHFVLLLTASDDEGFFRANPRSLLGQLYPHDGDVTEADVLEMNAALEAIGLLAFCATPDGSLGKLRNWSKHQRIDRPSKSHLGEIFASHSRDTREGSSTGVLSPESLGGSDVVDELAEAEKVGAVNIREPALTALFLCICANKAVAARWGEQMHPYTQANTASLERELRDAGVEPEVARLSLYRQCRELNMPKPPRSVNYFRPGILSDWEAEKTLRIVAASGEVAPPPEAHAPKANGARRDTERPIADQLAEWARKTDADEAAKRGKVPA